MSTVIITLITAMTLITLIILITHITPIAFIAAIPPMTLLNDLIPVPSPVRRIEGSTIRQ